MLSCVCVGEVVGRDMFGYSPPVAMGKDCPPPPSWAATFFLQDTVFPDVGGTSVRDGEKIESEMWVSSRMGKEESEFIYSLRRANQASRRETGPGSRLHFPK